MPGACSPCCLALTSAAIAAAGLGSAVTPSTGFVCVGAGSGEVDDVFSYEMNRSTRTAFSTSQTSRRIAPGSSCRASAPSRATIIHRPRPFEGCNTHCRMRTLLLLIDAPTDQERRSKPNRRSHKQSTPEKVAATSQVRFLSRQKETTGPKCRGLSMDSSILMSLRSKSAIEEWFVT